MIIDSHCHLAGEEFAGDLDAVAARAREAGVDTALCILASGDDGGAGARAGRAAAWPGVRFATGIHPHQAGKFAGQVAAAVETVARTIDSTARAGSARSAWTTTTISRRATCSRRSFARRSVSRATRPADHHSHPRGDRRYVPRSSARKRAARGVFHCFTGDAAMADEALELGFHLSFAGIVTFPKAGDLARRREGDTRSIGC